MSEQFPSKASRAETASFVQNMNKTAEQLKDSHKDLASIDPIVEALVETDVASEDFGRIKNIAFAEDMAERRNDLHDAVAPYIARAREAGTLTDASLKDLHDSDDEVVDRHADFSIRYATPLDYGVDAKEKAVQDFRITQGDQAAMDRRTTEITYALETPTRGFATNIGRSMVAALKARKSSKN